LENSHSSYGAGSPCLGLSMRDRRSNGTGRIPLRLLFRHHRPCRNSRRLSGTDN
jgi:hypothetical protein